MIKIRKGKDIVFRWAILTNGKPMNLQGRNLSIEVVDPYSRRAELPYITDGNVIVFKFKGVEHAKLGIHGVTLWENKGMDGQTAVDICKAFELVSCSEQEDNGGATDSPAVVSSTGLSVLDMTATTVSLGSSNLTASLSVSGFTVKDIPQGEYDIKEHYPDI